MSAFVTTMRFEEHLDSNRLALRTLRFRDFWFFCKLIGNKQVRRYLGGPVAWQQRLFRFMQYQSSPDHIGVWVVRLAKGNRPIGLVELGPHKDGTDYEISYQFYPTSWGKGYADEALQVVISHALRDAGLTRIIAETQSANLASCRVLRKLGSGLIANR